MADFAFAALVALAALQLASCGDDESEAPKQVCSTADHSGCAAGERCLVGKDGKNACFCNSDSGEGCADGLQCQVGPEGSPECFCHADNDTGCAEGEVCEEVVGGNSACFPPATVAGQVFELADGAPIEGAVVAARDANAVAVSGLAVTDAGGNYELAVPAPRNADGSVASFEFSLRADASGFVTFPTAPRIALPIDINGATGDPPRLESSATDIGMIPLANAAGLGTITGKVLADNPRGTLVVAGGATIVGGGATGLADTDGSYTVFNVPAGTLDVRGYKAGLQLEHASASVTAGQVTSGVDLASLGEALSVVSGKVEIVNPGAGSDTSVILTVDETFVENAARGETPPGLRAHPVSGTFSIAGVPDGNYVVLAAFENDFLVRDPDTSIGGTSLVRITVKGGDVAIAESFKVTGSLNVVSPDQEQVVSGTPSFVWEDDSGEDHYEIRVYDAYGTLVWEDTAIPGVSGDKNVTVPYAGPPLQSGLLYQFRATSIKQGGTPISITEDLRGVFLYQ